MMDLSHRNSKPKMVRLIAARRIVNKMQYEFCHLLAVKLANKLLSYIISTKVSRRMLRGHFVYRGTLFDIWIEEFERYFITSLARLRALKRRGPRRFQIAESTRKKLNCRRERRFEDKIRFPLLLCMSADPDGNIWKFLRGRNLHTLLLKPGLLVFRLKRRDCNQAGICIKFHLFLLQAQTSDPPIWVPVLCTKHKIKLTS